VLLALWGAVVVSWFGYLTWYSNAPGAVSAAPIDWPHNSTIELAEDRPSLLMFIHPRCPCTSASLDELAEIIARCRDLATYYCIFVLPPEVPPDWEQGRLWRKASGLSRVQCIVDSHGREAKRFGAKTSGAVQVYSDAGKLVFNGGVTGARNHDGDNVGATAVTRWIRARHAEVTETFVFGCPLF